MNCPKCGSKSGVIDSRYTKTSIRRRMVCQDCGQRFTTYEFTIDQLPVIIGKLYGRNLAASAGLAAGEAVMSTIREMVFQSENIIKALKECEE